MVPMFMPSFTPPAPQQVPQPAGPAEVFYGRGAVKFGPGAKPMADVTDFQGRKAQAREALELALEGEGGENQAENAYERLMALADDPAMNINDLMKIVRG